MSPRKLLLHALAFLLAATAPVRAAAAAPESATLVARAAGAADKLGPASSINPGSVLGTSSTSSRSWVTLVGPGFDVDTVGTSTILVQLTTYGYLTEADSTLYVRATVDGVAVNPGSMRFTGTRNSSIAYTGWISGVAAGRHSVRLQWMVSAGTARVGNRTTVVTVIPE